MKIDCGVERKSLTDKELRQLKKWRTQGDRWRARHAHLTVWHPWFAWYPVRLKDHNCRWFEWVEQRKEFYGGVYVTGFMIRNTYYRASETKNPSLEARA